MSESNLFVYHNHVLIGIHDARCLELPAIYNIPPSYYCTIVSDDLVICEDGVITTYPLGTWSAAAIDLPCGFMSSHGPDINCARCNGDGEHYAGLDTISKENGDI